MTLHSVYTLNDSEATRITPNKLHSGMDITIQNINPSGYIYVGGQNVNALNYGHRILPNHSVAFELPGYDELYLISSAPDMKAAVIKINLEK
jgi:hypothetical protein